MVLCSVHKTSIINQIIQGVNIEEYISSKEQPNIVGDTEDINNIDNENDLIENIELESSIFGSWLESIEKETDEMIFAQDNGDHDNAMYNPKFAKYFLRLCKLLPLWSFISCPFFNINEITHSSADVESYFKNVKQSLGDIIPCSVDVFIEENIEMIKGITIEASQTQNYLEFVGQSDRNGDAALTDTSEHAYQNNNTSIEQIVDTIEDEIIDERDVNDESIIRDPCNTAIETTCIACRNNDQPSGAHKCVQCGRNVHVLDGCSVSCGDEEGYGQGRICIPCSSKQSSVSQTASEMSYVESWNKKPSKKSSKYLAPMPNWHLNTNVKKKVKIGILKNGNLTQCTYRTSRKKTVGLRNTCAFDATCQVGHKSQLNLFTLFYKIELIEANLFYRYWLVRTHIIWHIVNTWMECHLVYSKYRLL